MARFKLVIGTTEGRCAQLELSEEQSSQLLGKKIGESISGETIGLLGYELLITGGSDYCGFPMRRDAQGVGRKKILAVSGVGLKKVGKGVRIRKTVAGNTIHDKTAQVNAKVVTAGSTPLPFKQKEEGANTKKEHT